MRRVYPKQGLCLPDILNRLICIQIVITSYSIHYTKLYELRDLMENNVCKADMHIHTKYSGMMKYMGLKFPDSVEEPLKVMKCAKANGMDIIAVTDHNTIKGALETKKYEKEFGIEVVVGSEIMSKDGEILGLS